MRTVKLGLFGLGNVGSGLYKILKENASLYEQVDGVRFEIGNILVRDLKKVRIAEEENLTTNADDIINDSSIDIVIETMGGTSPALDYLTRALLSGKTVITANKEVVAKHWEELFAAAKKGNAGLYFEASVCGGIPVIKVLNESMRSNQVHEILGILNGTTNYILSRMTEEKLPFAEVLADAQRLGYAEPDPTADIEGIDAACKISILAALACNTRIPFENIYREGITKISDSDILYAQELGYAIKLLGIARKGDRGVDIRVHPALIPTTHPLASVSGAYNAVFIRGNAVGDLMLYGKGAGDLPTGSSLISDLLTACRNLDNHTNLYYHLDSLSADSQIDTNFATEYYVRLSVKESPGVLSTISGIFGQHDISLSSVMQKEYNQEKSAATVVFITHRATEQALRNAMEDLSLSSVVHSIDSIIRVEN